MPNVTKQETNIAMWSPCRRRTITSICVALAVWSTGLYVIMKSVFSSTGQANQLTETIGNMLSNRTGRRLANEKNGHMSRDEAKVVVQIDQKFLFMIDEIQASDTSPKGRVKPGPPGHISCLPRDPKDIEDILCMTPPTFLSKFKNPCWYGSDGSFQCLPYFQIIGMDKCGSTDLFDRIAHHPDVLKNKGVLSKETMWWSWHRYGHRLKQSRPTKSFQQYIDFFSNAAKDIEKDKDGRLITGDGTPMDMWDNSGWTSIPQNHGLREPKYITAHLIRHVNPDVRLLVILRDPVERLYSDYFFLGLGVMTPEAFHDNVIKSIKLLHNCTRTNSLRACLYNRRLHIGITARLHLGFYVIFLKDWFSVFPREKILILQTEHFANNTKDTVNRAFDFLKLRPLPQSEMDKIGTAARKHKTKLKQKAGAMKDETKEILHQLYDSFNQELHTILGDETFLWKTPS